MSTVIFIGNEVITLPSSGSPENWAEAIDDAFIAIAAQLQGIASQFDISPRVQILSSDANTNLNLDSVIFPSGSVRGFSFNYAIYRTNGVTALAETGFVNGVYNTLAATWVLQHEFQGPRNTDGSVYHSFNMSGDQMQLSTIALGGAYDNINSKISLSAKTVLVTDI